MSIKNKLQERLKQNQTAHAKAPEPHLEDDALSFQLIPLAQITPNPFQPRKRFDDAELVELMESVEQEGLLQPILVRPNGARGYELISGERRLKVFQRLKRVEIPALVRSMSDLESATSALQENLKREQLTDFEVSLALKQLIAMFEREEGAPQNITVLSKRLGISRPALYRYVSFHELPPKVLSELEVSPHLLTGTTSLSLKRWIDREREAGRSYEGYAEALLSALSALAAGQLKQRQVKPWVEAKLTASPAQLEGSELPLMSAGVTWREKKHVVQISLARKQLTEAQLERVKAFLESL